MHDHSREESGVWILLDAGLLQPARVDFLRQPATLRKSVWICKHMPHPSTAPSRKMTVVGHHHPTVRADLTPPIRLSLVITTGQRRLLRTRMHPQLHFPPSTLMAECWHPHTVIPKSSLHLPKAHDPARRLPGSRSLSQTSTTYNGWNARNTGVALGAWC